MTKIRVWHMRCAFPGIVWLILAGVATACMTAKVSVAATSPTRALAAIETEYADLNDAYGAIALIDSGLDTSFAGRDRQAWNQIYTARRKAVNEGLAKIATRGLPAQDRRAVKLMRAAVESLPGTPDSLAPVSRCSDARNPDNDLQYAALREALYACFAELANDLEFEGDKINRVAAFDLLARMDEGQRRKALFYAFVPLWQAINGNGEPGSPYRRMIAMAAADAKQHGSRIDAAARTVGTTAADVEAWLEQILDTWRQVSADTPVEPWDYRYTGGAAERALGQSIPRAALQPLSERYYLELGADLKGWGTIYDLDPRSGKAPLAYTDYVRRGRMVDGAWQPTIARVSASYARGGLGLLNELMHENGHVVHMMALHARPAFMDLGDAIFFEAFADVPSWSIYEPAWQQKYLGRSASQSSSLRALYSNVMLDVAWALFDLRMLRDPARDPNVVWTEITSRYLHIVAHPELSWWAVRVQLVDSPGYMVNYGLGSVITAAIRQRIDEQLGPFTTGDVRWYGWIRERLLKSGQARETAALLRDFLGGPVSPHALLAELRRVAATGDAGVP